MYLYIYIYICKGKTHLMTCLRGHKRKAEIQLQPTRNAALNVVLVVNRTPRPLYVRITDPVRIVQDVGGSGWGL
jgi:hypothetical protein